jgi:molybdopterin synthase catalytic subunit
MKLIRVQEDDFDAGTLLDELRAGRSDIGASVMFTGYVRDLNLDDGIRALRLEHYPGMTEKALEEIVDRAMHRWNLSGAAVIHRIGELLPTDRIVLVAVTSAHRGDAFEACEFIMDYLKTRAPFWKKEQLADGSSRWVEARSSDDKAAERWKERS